MQMKGVGLWKNFSVGPLREFTRERTKFITYVGSNNVSYFYIFSFIFMITITN